MPNLYSAFVLPAGVHLRSTAPDDALVQELEAGIASALAELGIARTDPDKADVVLFVEPLANTFRGDADALLADPVLRETPERCFVFEQCDRPVPYLPGLYVSLPARRHDPSRTRAVPSWGAADESVARTLIGEVDASLLFSFRGYPNAPVRGALLAARFARDDVSVSATSRFWDYGHDEEARHDYLREVRSSLFVLCPRGWGTSTRRLYETMQLGRVPVVLSDEWAPPAGLAWDDFSLRVDERDVARLPAILEKRADDAEAMGLRARDAWEEHCRAGAPLVRSLLRGVEEIRTARAAAGWDESAMRRRWRSTAFRWRHRIHVAQGIGRRLTPRARAAGPRSSAPR
jgi:hypothetical protein